MTPAPTTRHQRVLGNLYAALRAWVAPRGLGEILLAPVDVLLPSGDVVQPDLQFVASANRGSVEDRIEGVPDLLIEIVSPTHAERDRIVKRDLYASNGGREFWIVDTESRAVEVFRLKGRRFDPAGYFEAADALKSPTFEGLALAVRTIFE